MSRNWLDSIVPTLRSAGAGLKVGATSNALAAYFVDTTWATVAIDLCISNVLIRDKKRELGVAKQILQKLGTASSSAGVLAYLAA